MEILTVRATRRRRSIAALSLCLLALPAASYGADNAALENAVKATYLYKFAPFVQWPASSFSATDSALILCVVGDDQVGALLDQAAAGQRVDARPVTVRHLATVAADSGCHILYVAGPDEQKTQALDAVRGAAILTVTDATSGGVKGMIDFVVRDSRVRFEIDDNAASRAGLVISSKLLSLAISVTPRPDGP